MRMTTRRSLTRAAEFPLAAKPAASGGITACHSLFLRCCVFVSRCQDFGEREPPRRSLRAPRAPANPRTPTRPEPTTPPRINSALRPPSPLSKSVNRIHFACGRASNFRALVRVSSASHLAPTVTIGQISNPMMTLVHWGDRGGYGYGGGWSRHGYGGDWGRHGYGGEWGGRGGRGYGGGSGRRGYRGGWVGVGMAAGGGEHAALRLVYLV